MTRTVDALLARSYFLFLGCSCFLLENTCGVERDGCIEILARFYSSVCCEIVRDPYSSILLKTQQICPKSLIGRFWKASYDTCFFGPSIQLCTTRASTLEEDFSSSAQLKGDFRHSFLVYLLQVGHSSPGANPIQYNSDHFCAYLVALYVSLPAPIFRQISRARS